MAGIVHLRIVIAVFLVGGIAALMPYALSLFSEDVKPTPFGWVGGLSSIALALWLTRGSNIARALLIMFPSLGLAFYGYLALMIGSRSWTTAALIGVFALLSAYSLWALAFSRDVRVELARRRGTNLDEENGQTPRALWGASQVMLRLRNDRRRLCRPRRCGPARLD